MAGLKITSDPAVFSFLLTEDLYPIKEISPREESSPQAVPQEASPRIAPQETFHRTAPEEASPRADKLFHYLGENRRFILILVNYPEEKYLPEAEKAYLAKILSAVKLDLEDVALLNYAHYPGSKYAELKDFFAFNSLLLFGVGPNLLQIPGPVLPYHLGLVEGVKILAADSTEVFRPDAGKKKSLWEELKKVFS